MNYAHTPLVALARNKVQSAYPWMPLEQVRIIPSNAKK